MAIDLITDDKGQYWFTESDRDNLKISYKVKKILYNGCSDYQDIAVLDLYDYGRSLVLDGAIQITELDSRIYNEMLVHMPVIIHRNVKRVLVIGAGSCGNINELVKYPSIENIDVVEIDKKVVDICLKNIPDISKGSTRDKRVKFYYKNGNDYVSNPINKGRYDLVLVDSSDPVGPSEVLFSELFYSNIYNVLSGSGIAVYQSESMLFYKDILLKARKSLRSIFPIVETYYFPMPCFPGGLWNFIMASKEYSSADSNPAILPSDISFIQKEKIPLYFSIPGVFQYNRKI